MSFELNNIDTLIKEKITQKLSSYQQHVGSSFDIQEVIPYCLFSNKTFQSKIHKITSEEREAYKTRINALFSAMDPNSEATEENKNSLLAEMFNDPTITVSNFDEKFPKFSLINFEALFANIYRINMEIYNAFIATDDSKKINMDDIFYNLSTINNNSLISNNYVTSNQRNKYFFYPGQLCSTVVVYADNEYVYFPGVLDLHSNIEDIPYGLNEPNGCIKYFKLFLSLLFSNKTYNGLNMASFVLGQMTDEQYYEKFDNSNIAKYTNCVFEDLNDESDSFDVYSNPFDGYDNYQSSDEMVSAADAINECYKFMHFLRYLFLYEFTTCIQTKYSNLIEVNSFSGLMGGIDELTRDLISTFKLVLSLIDDGIYGLTNNSNPVKLIPSYNEYDAICKESVKEVIEDLVTEHFGKTKTGNN